ncbi:MAG: hypothetical protein K2F88_03390, partial [Duncaniella sp.]|nr:hypothetical protein [Duncaniella sp.]
MRLPNFNNLAKETPRLRKLKKVSDMKLLKKENIIPSPAKVLGAYDSSSQNFRSDFNYCSETPSKESVMAKDFDFDRIVDRRGSGCMKWDERPEALPLWVADMDFQTAPCVVEAL